MTKRVEYLNGSKRLSKDTWFGGRLRVSKPLRNAWGPIVDYLRFELARSARGIATATLGDWVGPDTDPGGGIPDEDPRVSATVFLAMMFATAAKIARVLGEPGGEWQMAREQVGHAFLAEFFDSETGSVRGVGDDGFRQSHQVLALAVDLIPPEQIGSVVHGLVADVRARGNRLNTGALATKWLLPVLTEYGHADLAFAIATQRTFPSWGFWVDSGATSLWEHWHADSRSRGHYFLGTIDDWLFEHVAGLAPIEPGWQRARIAPRCTHLLERASAEVATPYGRLAVDWHRTPSELRIAIDVPVGVVATVEVGGFCRDYSSGQHDIIVRSRQARGS
ncbi:alpha-L-rhamnosidase C-terminal domain-containing protein [Microbacterium sp. NPDC076911]|uniref:alpha-L-rhamnosidase-related protein n=1 Tax=Microbacterium sp. NPDC076911 TaxID=3154958 RepID=UPI00343CBE37